MERTRAARAARSRNYEDKLAGILRARGYTVLRREESGKPFNISTPQNLARIDPDPGTGSPWWEVADRNGDRWQVDISSPTDLVAGGIARAYVWRRAADQAMTRGDEAGWAFPALVEAFGPLTPLAGGMPHPPFPAYDHHQAVERARTHKFDGGADDETWCVSEVSGLRCSLDALAAVHTTAVSDFVGSPGAPKVAERDHCDAPDCRCGS